MVLCPLPVAPWWRGIATTAWPRHEGPPSARANRAMAGGPSWLNVLLDAANEISASAI